MYIDNKELITNIATNIVENSIKFAWQKVSKFFRDLDAAEAIRYGIAYEEYLLNTERKNSKIKTIIYRRVPKDLYSFYECIGVSYNGQIISTNSIKNLIDTESKIIITGTGGVGKSILFKHLFLSTIRDTDCIPVLIELRSFNIYETKDISLFGAIYQSLCDNGFNLSEEYFEHSMKEGGYIIFLDGYDEVNRGRTEKVTNEIKSLAAKYNNNKYLVSSRPTDAFIGWNDFAEMVAMKLTKKQALSLIKKIEFDEVTKETFYHELESNLYDRYESFASNPLLLNIMLLTFQKHASIPDRLNDFYEEAFSTLFNAHDATKDSYVRDIRTGLGCEDFKLIFAYICFKSYFKDEYEFSETQLRGYLQLAKEKFDRIKFSIEDFQDDLTMSVCMLVKEGLNYRFSHRSFQEYFAAWYTCKLLDDVQGKLLAAWIKESDSIFFDSYFEMLFDLQSEKVNKIVLIPALKQVRRLYESLGFTVNFLRELFSGVVIEKRRDKNRKVKYHMSLPIRNAYLCRCMILNNRLNDYTFSGELSIGEDEFINKLIKSRLENHANENKKFLGREEWTFDGVLQVVSEEELLENVRWFERHILFAISIIEKYSDENVNKKRKVSSLLEQL